MCGIEAAGSAARSTAIEQEQAVLHDEELAHQHRDQQIPLRAQYWPRRGKNRVLKFSMHIPRPPVSLVSGFPMMKLNSC
ncbi:hypothetical protein BJP07_00910 [Corynebacterium sp. NML130628]|nr:hypothetical protein BJP07_00910 [Corynebacterium sp. NML130628]